MLYAGANRSLLGMQMGRMGSVGGQMTDLQRILAIPGMGPLWDFSDTSTMFQDSAGKLPVTAFGQPDGLVLDKSKGLVLGAELVVNGGFDTDTVGWVSSPSYPSSAAAVSGEMQVTVPAVFGRQMYAFPTVVGTMYRLSGSARLVSGSGGSGAYFGYSPDIYGGDFVYVAPTVSATAAPSSITFVAQTTTSYVFCALNTDGDGVGSFDNISVREIPGVHLVQPTAPARPLYQINPARAVFDGTDDVLTATFPASLGSNCTVVRSLPGTGASILTGQTIGTTYNITTTSCAWLVFNRALTADETALVTRWANQKAGV